MVGNKLIRRSAYLLPKMKLARVLKLGPIVYDVEILQRAFDIAKIVGFRNINDCIHTAIAESNCTELITYNKRDFSKIKEFTKIAVTIL